MGRYLARRLLQMIPTVLGVLLITFVLFNVVGGSPASMVLGEHVSPATLEDFDEQRGFNKPLLFGRWTTTRAWPEPEESAPRTLGPGEHILPLAFGLRPDTGYRLVVEARAAGDFPNIGKTTVQFFQCLEKTGAFFPIIGKNGAEFSNVWKKTEFFFQSLENTSTTDLRLAVQGAPLEIRSIQLRRRMAGPWDSQFFYFLKKIAQLDFGTSSSLNQPVTRLLAEGIGPTLALTIPIFTLELALAVSLALVCAFWRDRWPDRLAVVVAVGLMSVNYLVWIVAGQYLLGHRLGWFPVWGFESWRYLLLPVFIGVVSGLGSSLRFYRTVMLDEMGKGYVRTAFAKGVSRRGVLFRHVLRNALIPVITNVALTIPYLYTGSLLLESFFGIPGLGYLGVNAVNSADVDVVRAIVLIGSVLYVLVNLLTDVAYAWVDPRVRLQ
ncbi:MAG: ABC transporter permease [Kiritimatiellae bacterium]|nr:ABC transporter permease [Kiritimatiellia bacterium]